MRPATHSSSLESTYRKVTHWVSPLLLRGDQGWGMGGGYQDIRKGPSGKHWSCRWESHSLESGSFRQKEGKLQVEREPKGAVRALATRGRPHGLGPGFSAGLAWPRKGGAGAWVEIWPLPEECGLWLVRAFRLAQECEQGVHCAPWMHTLVLLPLLNTSQDLVRHPTEPAERSPVLPG